MRDRELFMEMSKSARLATDACIAAGYGRGDRVTKESARLAADEVHRRERPEDYGLPVVGPAETPVDDGWEERADLE